MPRSRNQKNNNERRKVAVSLRGRPAEREILVSRERGGETERERLGRVEIISRRTRAMEDFWSRLNRAVEDAEPALAADAELREQLAVERDDLKELYEQIRRRAGGKVSGTGGFKALLREFARFSEMAQKFRKRLFEAGQKIRGSEPEGRAEFSDADAERLLKAMMGESPLAREGGKEGVDDSGLSDEAEDILSAVKANSRRGKAAGTEGPEERELMENLIVETGDGSRPAAKDKEQEADDRTQDLVYKLTVLGWACEELKGQIKNALREGAQRAELMPRLRRLNDALNQMAGKKSPYRQLAMRAEADFGIAPELIYPAVAGELMRLYYPLSEDKSVDAGKAIEEIVRKFNLMKLKGQTGAGNEEPLETTEIALSEETELKKEQLAFEIIALGLTFASGLRESEPGLRFRDMKRKLDEKLEAVFGQRVWQTAMDSYRKLISALEADEASMAGPEKENAVVPEKPARKEKVDELVKTAGELFANLPNPFRGLGEYQTPDFAEKEGAIRAAIGRLQAEILKSDLSKSEIQTALQQVVDNLLSKTEVAAARLVCSALPKGHRIKLEMKRDLLLKAKDELEKDESAGRPVSANADGMSDYNWAVMILKNPIHK